MKVAALISLFILRLWWITGRAVEGVVLDLLLRRRDLEERAAVRLYGLSWPAPQPVVRRTMSYAQVEEQLRQRRRSGRGSTEEQQRLVDAMGEGLRRL